jgi:hypothetical protein
LKATVRAALSAQKAGLDRLAVVLEKDLRDVRIITGGQDRQPF